MQQRQEILNFWFEEIDPQLWFSQRDDDFDARVKGRFLSTYEQARDGDYDGWSSEAEGCLGLCILLDQFPRQLFRGKAEAFATDSKILSIVKEALEKGFDKELEPNKRRFVYLPFEHSEDMSDQKRNLELFEAMKDEDPLGYDYALRHIDIIERFGRFPQRNVALGREMKPEEQEYLDSLEQAGRNY